MMLPPAHSGSIGILLYTILYCRPEIISVLLTLSPGYNLVLDPQQSLMPLFQNGVSVSGSLCGLVGSL